MSKKPDLYAAPLTGGGFSTMKTFLERQHRQRLSEPGWDAQVSDFHSNGCQFRFCGRNYSLTRSGDGFLVRCGQDLIWPTATYPDAALAHVWRHSRNQ